MIDISFLIPAREEIYLEKTIKNILANIRGNSEIIVILDGYLPNPQIVTNDERVTFIHNAIPLGQRAAVNQAARVAKGQFICKIDAHCAIDEGFDVKMMADCEYSWTVIPRMYNLDIEKFEPKLHKRTDYMYIGNAPGKELRAEYYSRQPSSTAEIDDTMACMGPCWFMHKDRFWELGGMDENHGSWGAMSVEVSLKAWLSGGALKVNKKTWFSHWFRGNVGFPYPISQKDVDKARNYSIDLWKNNKWDKQVHTLEWLVNKFNPPTWEAKVDIFNKHAYYHTTINSKLKRDKHINWMGYKIIKYPNDLMTYQEIISKNKPDILIETGTKWGGSALYFAHLFDIIGKGQVITIDKYPQPDLPKHPRITYLVGGSTSTEVLSKVNELVVGKTVMISLDSSHTRRHVKRELVRYGYIVTKGQYMVVEDTNYPEIGAKDGPDEAVKWYLGQTNKFVVDPLENKWIYSCNPGGYLRKL